MDKQKLISVIMCVYNTNQEFLDEAVKSILNQTYQNFELIIVDDASSKDLYANDLYKNKKIRIFRNSINRGPSYSRNVGIDASRGEYIAFMDSDDLSREDRLEKQILFLESNADYVACSCWYKEFGARSREIHIDLDDFEYYRCCLFFKNDPQLHCSALMARSNILKEIKLDEKIRFGEDWKLWVQLSEKGKIGNIKEVVSFYRIHDEGLTTLHKKGIQINEKNGAIGARTYIKNRMGINYTFKEDECLYLTDFCKKVKPRIFKNALKLLINRNKQVHYYNENALERKCNDVWKQYIMQLWNPLLLFSGLTIKKNHIFRIKVSQIMRRIFKKQLRN